MNAARRDLADIALAGRWFAPHYAIPQPMGCGLAGADILSSPDGPRVSQLLPGERFSVIETGGAWAWGYCEQDRYVGYVRNESLVSSLKTTHVTIARAALVFEEPSSRASFRAVLPMGARVEGRIESDFLRIDQGFVPLQHVRPADEQDSEPVAVAERLIDLPYLWGGRGIGGIDCSGLVQLAFGLTGIDLPRDSDQQIMAGRDADGALRRGDMLFFPDHVVLLSAPDRAVHASGHWMAVVSEPLSDTIARLGEPIARRRVLS